MRILPNCHVENADSVAGFLVRIEPLREKAKILVFVYAFVLAAMFGNTVCAQAKQISQADIDRSRTRINSWKPWLGTWQGSLKLEIEGSKNLVAQGKEPMDFRILLEADRVEVFFRDQLNNWQSAQARTQAYAFSPISLVASIYAEGPAWTETITVVLTRSDDDVTDISFVRAVNNWAAVTGKGVPARFSQYRVGELRRIGAADATQKKQKQD